jgi:hypothetical protein
VSPDTSRSNFVQDEDLGRYIHLLVAYLNRCPKVKLDVWEEEEEEEEDNDDDDDDKKGENENRK